MIWFGFIFVCIGTYVQQMSLSTWTWTWATQSHAVDGFWVGSSVKDEPWRLCLNNGLLYIGIDIAFAIIGIDCEK